MTQFRKKPVLIEAFQLSYEAAKGIEPVPRWAKEAQENEDLTFSFTDKIEGSQMATIKTREGLMTASPNDYIIQGVNGEIYPCKPDIFNKTYTSDTAPGKSFSEALELLKDGACVCRYGWNGKGMYIFIIGDNGLSELAGGSSWTYTNGVNDNYPLLSFIAMKTATEEVVPWLASQTDILANDWQIVGC